MKNIVKITLIASLMSVNIWANMIRDDEKNIVKDDVSKLIWQDNNAVSINPKNWSDAKNYCMDLNFMGYTNWRLPNINELLSIVNFDSKNNLTNTIFQHNQNFYWTDTSFNYNKAWYINFQNNGKVSDGKEKSQEAYVRCVHSFPQFVRDDSKEVVLDNKHNHMWQDNSIVKTNAKNWTEANDYCQNLEFAGYDDWKLPLTTSLENILDENNTPKIVDAFKNTSANKYWGEQQGITSYRHWTIDFNTGKKEAYDNSTSNYIRCMRKISD